MLILCRDYQCIINSEHVFRYQLHEDNRDPSDITWDLLCDSVGEGKCGYFLATYKSEENAINSLYDLLLHLTTGGSAYTIKEDYDFE